MYVASVSSPNLTFSFIQRKFEGMKPEKASEDCFESGTPFFLVIDFCVLILSTDYMIKVL